MRYDYPIHINFGMLLSRTTKFNIFTYNFVKTFVFSYNTQKVLMFVCPTVLNSKFRLGSSVCCKKSDFGMLNRLKDVTVRTIYKSRQLVSVHPEVH